MWSPLALPCRSIIFLNSLLYLVSGEAGEASIATPNIELTPALIHYSPNPFLVFSEPRCPASTWDRQPGVLSNTSDFQKSEFHPWDEAPDCLRIINLAGEHNYCIYYSKSFANGRGISIITTPDVASSIAKSSAFEPSTLIPNTQTTSKFDPSKSPAFPPSFEVKEIAGRGKGLIANKTINHGDVISYNTPILIVGIQLFDGIGQEQSFQLFRDALAKLPTSTQELFYEQCTRESGVVGDVEDQVISEAEIENIMKTNSYTGYFPRATSKENEGEEETVTHGLNIPESSRLNHDCRPNTHFAFDIQTLTHRIHAIKTILPGEEITTSYIADMDPYYQDRKDLLLKHWGFHCTCSHCSASSSHRSQSDSRLRLINKYRTYLMDWSYESLGTTDLALKYIKLLTEEKLYSRLGEAYTIAALRFNAWEKEDEAKKYARMAVEKGLWWDAKEVFDLEEIARLEVQGRKHWSWGLGRKLRIGQDGTAPFEEHLPHAGMRLVKQQMIR